MRTVHLLSLLAGIVGITLAACTRELPAPLGGTEPGSTAASADRRAPVPDFRPSVYQYAPLSIQGVRTPLKQFRGRKLLIVNVASRCGFTPQYNALQQLWQQYGNRVVVLGFPCNQFGGQEPDGDSTIYQNCVNNYGVTFPMFSKVDVKGPNQTPLYQYLTNRTANGVVSNTPTWNFAKYLVDENGYVLRYFAPATNPLDTAIVNAILR